jgi:hypothetical protein
MPTAAFSVCLFLDWMPRLKAGLRPAPQGVRTLAALAAPQGFGAGAGIRDAGSKSVFDRHSTQSLIAAEPTRKSRGFKALSVDIGVYATLGFVYGRAPVPSQVPEYPATPPYTAKSTERRM